MILINFLWKYLKVIILIFYCINHQHLFWFNPQGPFHEGDTISVGGINLDFHSLSEGMGIILW